MSLVLTQTGLDEARNRSYSINMTKTNETISWQARNDARIELNLRHLMSDLADAVERGEMSDLDANEQYSTVANRWMMES